MVLKCIKLALHTNIVDKICVALYLNPKGNQSINEHTNHYFL